MSLSKAGVLSALSRRRRHVVYVVSDHGFGHASRSSTVIAELQRRSVDVTVISSVPRWFFEEACTDFGYIQEQTDVGVHQSSSVHIDPARTFKALERFWSPRAFSARLERLSSLLAPLSSLRSASCMSSSASGQSETGSENTSLAAPSAEKPPTTTEEDTANSCSPSTDTTSAATENTSRASPANSPVDLVVYDIPALGPLLARQLRVPCVGVSNFSWLDIYPEYLAAEPRFAAHIERHHAAYSHTQLMIRLPYASDELSSFPASVPIVDLGAWLGRRSQHSTHSVRCTLAALLAHPPLPEPPLPSCARRTSDPSPLSLTTRSPLSSSSSSSVSISPSSSASSSSDEDPSHAGFTSPSPSSTPSPTSTAASSPTATLPWPASAPACTTLEPHHRLLLLSFGGHDFPIERLRHEAVPPGWRVLFVTRDSAASSVHSLGRVLFFPQRLLDHRDVTYMDLISAASVVVIKTGYGIISECVQAAKPVLYVDRPDFAEHAFMVRALQENLPCALVNVEQVLACEPELFAKADQLLRACRSASSPLPLNGAERCADLILEQLTTYT
eukprot:CAMPEP_0177666198 /NCGR_PEP_ID=MMETSP0447-20121125/21455_1 /TAXON_ID=0 /ORGANISM="Stygamoeba regulata, Strain BSH-02190019" /LENGTH=559 /DNA_ID=CAMNT_0019172333 /DNA_START=135 /DNA_END=1814 /DNA_ORIENTATION=-